MIKPNTKIRILSPEHSEYVQKLAFESGFSWPINGQSVSNKSADSLYFWSDREIRYGSFLSFEGDEKEEIFIDMPAEPSIESRILAEKVGTKHDQGKPRYDLMPVHAEAAVVDVLTFGANKYAPNNWRHVDDATQRYTAAALRHLAAYRMGEQEDPESKMPHLAHAVCCLMFMLELDSEVDA